MFKLKTSTKIFTALTFVNIYDEITQFDKQ